MTKTASTRAMIGTANGRTDSIHTDRLGSSADVREPVMVMIPVDVGCASTVPVDGRYKELGFVRPDVRAKRGLTLDESRPDHGDSHVRTVVRLRCQTSASASMQAAFRLAQDHGTSAVVR